MHKAYVILLFILTVAAGVASGHYFGTRAAATAAAPIAILDITSFTDAATEGVAPNEIPSKLEEGYKNALRRASALADSGFIVLNRDHIIKAPDYYMIEAAERK